jgi:uncharacterized protein YndB with AHSA1/START domain
MHTPSPARSVAPGLLDTEISLEREYPHPRAKVWQALTQPQLIAAWLMRPEGFEPKVGCKFRLSAKPQPGWRGYVDCEITDLVPERLLRYTWAGDDSGRVMAVTWTLDEASGGTRLSLLHQGFRGPGGWFLARLILGPGWKKMMARRIPSVLDRLRHDGSFRADPALDKNCHVE